MRKKTIVFLLPTLPLSLSGGFKVVYEYANRFAADGYAVEIIYPFYIKASRRRLIGKCFEIFNCFFRFIEYHLKTNSLDCNVKWFKLNNSIKEKHVFELSRLQYQDDDVCVATFWKTAEYLHHLDFKGRKLYLIQGYEIWGGRPEDVHATWKYPLEKIVVSAYLLELIKQHGEEAHLIESGLDFEKFGLQDSIEERDNTVILLNHAAPIKNTRMGIDVLVRLKSRYPSMNAIMFGIPSRPLGLPEWIEYHRQPDHLEKLYNRASIYLGTSSSEGFGLTLCEAMQCGCTVVCTDNGGYKSIVTDEENALIVEVNDTNSMYEKANQLFTDLSKRIRLARKGYDKVQSYTWERAFSLFKNIIER